VRLRSKDSVEDPEDRKNDQELNEDAEEKEAEKGKHHKTFQAAQ
jgi:hypothetical protein